MLGGTVTAIGGGNFANGAASAAFVRLFNENYHGPMTSSYARIKAFIRDHQDLSSMLKVAAMRDLLQQLGRFERDASAMTLQAYEDWLAFHGDLDDVGARAFRDALTQEIKLDVFDGTEFALSQTYQEFAAPGVDDLVGRGIARDALTTISLIEAMKDFGSGPFRYEMQLCAPSVCGGPKYQVSLYWQ